MDRTPTAPLTRSFRSRGNNIWEIQLFTRDTVSSFFFFKTESNRPLQCLRLPALHSLSSHYTLSLRQRDDELGASGGTRQAEGSRDGDTPPRVSFSRTMPAGLTREWDPRDDINSLPARSQSMVRQVTCAWQRACWVKLSVGFTIWIRQRVVDFLAQDWQVIFRRKGLRARENLVISSARVDWLSSNDNVIVCVVNNDPVGKYVDSEGVSRFIIFSALSCHAEISMKIRGGCRYLLACFCSTSYVRVK